MTSIHAHRGVICLVLSITAAACVAGYAAAERPAGMSKAAYAALMARSDGLNRLYHLGEYARPTAAAVPARMTPDEYRAAVARGKALNERYGNGLTRMTRDEFRALYLQSDALNRQYHLGEYATPVSSPATAAPGAGGGVDWTNVAIGVATGLGLLLAVGAAVASRGRWHPPVRPTH